MRVVPIVSGIRHYSAYVLKSSQTARSKSRSLTAPTVSGFLWCKMKGQSVLHQFLHQFNEKIRQDLRRYEKYENRETVAPQRFEKI